MNNNEQNGKKVFKLQPNFVEVREVKAELCFWKVLMNISMKRD